MRETNIARRIRKAARSLAIEKHPDKVKQRGGSEEEVRRADDEVKKVNGSKDALLDPKLVIFPCSALQKPILTLNSGEIMMMTS